jgi:hypothetical protein
MPLNNNTDKQTNKKTPHKKSHLMGAGEMAQQLRALTTFPSVMGSDALFWCV